MPPLLDSFAVPVTVERQQPGSRVDGAWQPGAVTTLLVRASVQHAGFKDLQLLPEGQRTTEAIRLYAESELRTVDETAGAAADVVLWNGKHYAVEHVQSWTLGGLSHWKAIAVKREGE